jgi:hypothetical protein
MEKSKFERIGDDGLIRYRNHVKKLLSEAGIGFEDISDFYSFLNSNYRTEHSGLKKSIMSPMGGSFKRTDIEYLYYILYVPNQDDGKITRPTFEYKEIEYISEERILTRITRSGGIDTYIPDNLDSGYLFDLRGSGDFEPYDWDETDREELDWDQRDDWFDFN